MSLAGEVAPGGHTAAPSQVIIDFQIFTCLGWERQGEKLLFRCYRPSGSNVLQETGLQERGKLSTSYGRKYSLKRRPANDQQDCRKRTKDPTTINENTSRINTTETPKIPETFPFFQRFLFLSLLPFELLKHPSTGPRSV